MRSSVDIVACPASSNASASSGAYPSVRAFLHHLLCDGARLEIAPRAQLHPRACQPRANLGDARCDRRGRRLDIGEQRVEILAGSGIGQRARREHQAGQRAGVRGLDQLRHRRHRRAIALEARHPAIEQRARLHALLMGQAGVPVPRRPPRLVILAAASPGAAARTARSRRGRASARERRFTPARFPTPRRCAPRRRDRRQPAPSASSARTTNAATPAAASAAPANHRCRTAPDRAPAPSAARSSTGSDRVGNGVAPRSMTACSQRGCAARAGFLQRLPQRRAESVLVGGGGDLAADPCSGAM